MSKQMSLQESLNHIQTEGGSIKFNFENGSSQIQNINKNVFINERGKQRDSSEILSIFKSISHDLGAVSFEF